MRLQRKHYKVAEELRGIPVTRDKEKLQCSAEEKYSTLTSTALYLLEIVKISKICFTHFSLTTLYASSLSGNVKLERSTK